MTQINPQNYEQATQGLDAEKLPTALRDGHYYTLENVGLYGQTMSLAEANVILRGMGRLEMDRNIEVGEFIDGHITALAAHLGKTAPAKAPRSQPATPGPDATEWREAITTLQLLLKTASPSAAQAAEWNDAINTLKILLS
jgi:hypothetical protein